MSDHNHLETLVVLEDDDFDGPSDEIRLDDSFIMFSFL